MTTSGRWLVSCFAPFAGAATNASAVVVDHLRTMDWSGRVDFLAPLPVSFDHAWPTLVKTLAAIDRGDVAGILSLGQAAGRRQVDLECLALNRIDAGTPGSDDHVYGPIDVSGPDVRWCPVPWTDFRSLHGSARSYSAGTYVCNALFYESLAWAAEAGLRAAFVHVPALESQPEFAHLPRLSTSFATSAVAEILRFLVKM